MDAAIVPAIIAACSALAGAFLSQAFSMFHQALERKHRRHALLREKLEELTDSLQQTVRWVELWVGNTRAGGRAAAPQPSPRSSDEARRVYVLSLLYFPALRAESLSLMGALNALLLGKDGVQLERVAKDYAAAKDRLNELIAIEAAKII